MSKNKVTWSDVYWPLWFIVGFGVPEAYAYFSKTSGDTLSEHVWKWFAVKDQGNSDALRARRTALLCGMAWVSFHFLNGGRY